MSINQNDKRFELKSRIERGIRLDLDDHHMTWCQTRGTKVQVRADRTVKVIIPRPPEERDRKSLVSMALQYRFFASPQEAKEAFPNETPWGQNPALGEVALSCAVGAIAGFVEDLFLPNRNLCNDDYSHVRKHVASAFLSDRDQCGNRGNFVVVYGISKEELEAKAKMKLPERIVFDVRPQGILRQMLFACLRFEDEAFALNVKAGRSPAGYEEHGRQAFWHNAANGLIVHPLAEALKKATGFPEYTESYFWFGK